MAQHEVEIPAVFSFPGQGAPYADLVLDLDDRNRLGTEDHDIFLSTLEEVRKGSEVDVLQLVHDKDDAGKKEDLADTRFAHLILLGGGLAAARILINRGVKDSYDRGHSAGAFVAAAVVGSLAGIAAAKAMKARGESMHAAALEDPGAMAATMGVSFDKLKELCAQIGEFVVPTNDNSPKQIMVAGTHKGLEILKESVRRFDGKLTVLRNWQAGMAHTEKVRRVQDVLEAIFNPQSTESIRLDDPITKYIKGIDGQIAETAEQVRIDLVSATQPVRFTPGTELLLNRGERRFIEIGPGRTDRARVLSGRLLEHDLPPGVRVEHVHDLLYLQRV